MFSSAKLFYVAELHLLGYNILPPLKDKVSLIFFGKIFLLLSLLECANIKLRLLRKCINVGQVFSAITGKI